jgi:pyridoxamine 5'-phosphate oxidase
MDIARIRNDYKKGQLRKSSVNADPIVQFSQWFEEAVKAEIHEVNAMTLATSTPGGIPAARMVLLKGFDQDGLVFFSNYLSRKGKELKANPNAALILFWKELERQVRIEGKVEYLSAEASDHYFNSRPDESKVSAIISEQSRIVPDRKFLEDLWEEKKEELENGMLKRPDNWGGFRVIPRMIEFWQGRPNRLSDRIVYFENEGQWEIKRLAP